MGWIIELERDFETEFHKLNENVQDELFAHVNLLRRFGAMLGRPYVDTLKGSQHTNMKELGFAVGKGVWRVAFIFDPMRKGVLLVAGDKRGKNQKQFYKQLIAKADRRYNDYITRLKKLTG